MSDAATLSPGSSFQVRAATAPTPWTVCLLVLAATALIVAGGQYTAGVVADGFKVWFASIDPRVLSVSGPVLVGIYQLVYLWLLVSWATGESRRHAMALRWPKLKVRHWVAIVVGLYAIKAGVSLLAVVATHPTGGAPAQPGSMPVQGLAPFAAVMRSQVWPLLLLGGVLAAVVEELVYRGFLSRTLEGSRLGFWGGAIVASVIWAGLHFYYPLSIQAGFVVVGVCLSAVRAKTGSVYPGMLWHVINNAVGLLAMRFLL